MADLDAIYEKIIRADQHFATLGEEVMSYLKTSTHTISPHINKHGTEARITYVVKPDPPIRLSILIGDCIHNVHSALDQLICCIVRTTNPASNCTDRHFPICSDPAKWTDERKVLRGLPEKAKTIIEGLQPCAKPSSAASHPLTILKKLSNRDKHRFPTLTATHSQQTALALSDGVNSSQIKLPKPLKSGTTLQLVNLPAWAKPGVNMQIKGTKVVAFDEPGPWDVHATANEAVYAPIQFVKQFVIPRLKAFVH